MNQAARDAFVRTTDYGRCVYDSDNDVVDHQVVNFEFAGGATGTFTMTAFAPGGRQLRVHGTKGYITADIEARRVTLQTFSTDPKSTTIHLPEEGGGHGGGDDNVLRSLVNAIREKDPSLVLTGTEESLRTHVVAFAAETSRRENRVVDIEEFLESSLRTQTRPVSVSISRKLRRTMDSYELETPK